MIYNNKTVDNYLNYMQKFQIHSLLAKVIAFKEYDDSTVERLFSKDFIYHPFDDFLEGEMAIERIEEAIESKEKICIYGDYDCDGVLATAILVDAFKQRNIEVGYFIPDRHSDGYGLTKKRVQQIYEKGYTLIITVDNGVKAFEAIDKANELGIDVIVTDHHSLDEENYIDAYCLIHTQISPDYSFKPISGGFIAYKLAHALLQKHDKYLYSLAAITTISDMMPLLDENRAVVKYGCMFMEEGKYLPLELLLEGKGKYDVQNIGFSIAPKINAVGRMPELMAPHILVKYFVRGSDQNFLQAVLAKMKSINTQRQNLTTSQYQKVMDKVDHSSSFLYCYEEEIHLGIIGLVAGRYTRSYYRPSFVMHYDEKTNSYKGSARGIKEASLNEIFDYCKDYLIGYGGHQLAGGFSVSKENLEPLKNKIQHFMDKIDMEKLEPTTDVLEITVNDLTIHGIKELNYLQPLGQSNEEVLFYIRDLPIEQCILLKDGKHLKYVVMTPSGKLELLYFNIADEVEVLKNKTSINVVGKLQIQTYRNVDTMNMIIDRII